MAERPRGDDRSRESGGAADPIATAAAEAVADEHGPAAAACAAELLRAPGGCSWAALRSACGAAAAQGLGLLCRYGLAARSGDGPGALYTLDPWHALLLLLHRRRVLADVGELHGQAAAAVCEALLLLGRTTAPEAVRAAAAAGPLGLELEAATAQCEAALQGLLAARAVLSDSRGELLVNPAWAAGAARSRACADAAREALGRDAACCVRLLLQGDPAEPPPPWSEDALAARDPGLGGDDPVRGALQSLAAPGALPLWQGGSAAGAERVAPSAGGPPQWRAAAAQLREAAQGGAVQLAVRRLLGGACERALQQLLLRGAATELEVATSALLSDADCSAALRALLARGLCAQQTVRGGRVVWGAGWAAVREAAGRIACDELLAASREARARAAELRAAAAAAPPAPPQGAAASPGELLLAAAYDALTEAERRQERAVALALALHRF
eukprot:TRINITY_DN28916_c0_g1_i1.p2 TRINITY_DN28916_c0_g1~~TRINITY_DN28916_c0_g1_i1.p2  ORF type:complete len:446 (+),score=143.48 TRINITY_DN28916_c0_g1_i1:96-1433(+)